MNKLFLLVGPSGSGKTTISRNVFSKTQEVISFTTREKRDEEKHGYDYFFITIEEFEKMRNNNLLGEYVEYNGNYYGLMLESIDDVLLDMDAYAIVDIHGFKQLKEIYKEKVIGIFLNVSREKVESNLLKRKDSPENIEKRLELYDEEIKNIVFFDEWDIILNCDDTVEKVVENLERILEKTFIPSFLLEDKEKKQKIKDKEEGEKQKQKNKHKVINKNKKTKHKKGLSKR